jgi:hypothetical protein
MCTVRELCFPAAMAAVLLLAAGSDPLSGEEKPVTKDRDEGRLQAVGLAGEARIGGKPVTVELGAPDEFRDRISSLASNRESTLRLSVVGLVPPKANVSVRIFLNDPTADATTEPDNPHYVGSFSFFVQPADPKSMVDFHLNLGPSVRRLEKNNKFDSKQKLEVTLFAVPIREGEVIDDLSIKFEKVVVTEAKGKRK